MFGGDRRDAEHVAGQGVGVHGVFARAGHCLKRCPDEGIYHLFALLNGELGEVISICEQIEMPA